MPSAMDKKTGLNLGRAVFAALAVLLVRVEGNSGSPPADMLARGSVANKPADALCAAVAAAAR
jgi:hypothetical protein